MRRPALTDRVIGVALAVAILLFLVGVVTGSLRSLFAGGGDRVVRAQFTDTRQLKEGGPVRISGVDVGKVKDVELAADRRSSVVTMEIDGEKAGPLYRDAGARIRFRTLLGGSFYVDLSRGMETGEPLGSETIPTRRTGSQVELDDLTTLLKGDVRRGLHAIPAELAAALRRPELPAAALRATARQSPSLEAGLEALRGTRPGSDVPALVRQTSRTVRALDAPAQRLRQLVSGAATLVRTTAARDAEIDRLLADAPGVLRRTDRTVDRLDVTLRAADPVLADVVEAAPAVAPTVAKLRALVAPANALLADALPLVRRLKPAVEDLASAARRGTPLLDAIEPPLRTLERTVLPYTGTVDPDSGHTPAQMVGPGISGLASIGSYLDNNGRLVRFPVSGGNSSFYLPCQAYLNNPDAAEMLACRALKKSVTSLFGWTERKHP
ncbi:MlaD family protein [Paraconexibacter sp.]|uniref:MlaD family protein n=1 Tax=Paraconexibacter sp. TaxID=2949640 RepID=UPI003561735B